MPRRRACRSRSTIGGRRSLTCATTDAACANRRVRDRRGSALLGMQERAADFGGHVHLAGAPGKGTSVRVRIPMAAATTTKGAAS